MSMMFGAGFGGGRYDQELQAKIDKMLAGKPSAKDKINEFVEHDLGVDPAQLPLNPKQALTRANEIAAERSAGSVVWDGNSLGLKQVVFSAQALNCPTCGGSDHADAEEYDPGKKGWLYCYDCAENGNGHEFFEPVYPSDVVTEHDKDKDWHDFERIWTALADEQGYSFRVTYSYYGDVPVEPITHEVNPDPKKLKTGQMVRLQKHVIDGDDEYVYARVGGLFSDQDICILPSMEPITDLSVWRVTEVL